MDDILTVDDYQNVVRMEKWKAKKEALESDKDFIAARVIDLYIDKPADLVKTAILRAHKAMDNGESKCKAWAIAENIIKQGNSLT